VNGYAYIGEQGDTLSYVVEGIGFDSRDMGDLLTPFTRKPDPTDEYQDWWGAEPCGQGWQDHLQGHALS